MKKRKEKHFSRPSHYVEFPALPYSYTPNVSWKRHSLVCPWYISLATFESCPWFPFFVLRSKLHFSTKASLLSWKLWCDAIQHIHIVGKVNQWRDWMISILPTFLDDIGLCEHSGSDYYRSYMPVSLLHDKKYIYVSSTQRTLMNQNEILDHQVWRDLWISFQWRYFHLFSAIQSLMLLP
jgi:hypothetical protein